MEKNIFVVILRYLVDKDIMSAARPAHLEFLKQHYAEGRFFASGKQTSGNGGVILAKAPDRHTLLEILHQDPFYTENLVEFQVFEFAPHNFSPSFGQFMETF